METDIRIWGYRNDAATGTSCRKGFMTTGQSIQSHMQRRMEMTARISEPTVPSGHRR